MVNYGFMTFDTSMKIIICIFDRHRNSVSINFKLENLLLDLLRLDRFQKAK